MSSGSGSGTSSSLERSMAKLRTRDHRALALLAAAAVAGATTAIAALLWLRQGGGKPTTGGYSSGRGARRASTGKKATPASDGGKLDREEISKAFDEISTLIESERLNADALERLKAQLLQLEKNMLASHEHVDELEGSFQAALDRHQQQTAAILAPLRQEVASLKHQLEILLFAANGRLSTGSAAGASSATAAPASSNNNNNNDTSPNNTATTTTKQRGRSSGAGLRDAGAALLGPGEDMVLEEQLRLEETDVVLRQSHLATVALALGVASPSRKGREGAASDASPRDANGFIISDWGDFHRTE